MVGALRAEDGALTSQLGRSLFAPGFLLGPSVLLLACSVGPSPQGLGIRRGKRGLSGRSTIGTSR
jgi:hypothetical protein